VLRDHINSRGTDWYAYCVKYYANLSHNQNVSEWITKCSYTGREVEWYYGMEIETQSWTWSWMKIQFKKPKYFNLQPYRCDLPILLHIHADMPIWCKKEEMTFGRIFMNPGCLYTCPLSSWMSYPQSPCTYVRHNVRVSKASTRCQLINPRSFCNGTWNKSLYDPWRVQAMIEDTRIGQVRSILWAKCIHSNTQLKVDAKFEN